MPDFQLNEEQQALQRATHEFAQREMMPQAAAYDESMDYPWPIIEKAFAQGLMNVFVPERHGGLGLSHLDVTLIVEQLAYGCSGMATAVTAQRTRPLAAGAGGQRGADQKIHPYAAGKAERGCLLCHRT